MGEVFADAGVVPLTGGGLPGRLDFDREPQGCAAMCEEAGLTPLDAREIHWVWRVSPDDLWNGLEAGIGVAGETLQAQRPEVRAEAHELFDERARESADADGILHFATRASFVLGTPAR